ncbi:MULTISPECIES: heme o synthase [Corynebacterium]|uniref:heme o synthase n=1 Tax=Corynebacterium TaxID=1716 RepID=UPI0008A1B84E|nr:MULTISPECIES: heme o synthase [Corynebacterium]MCX2162867.1 heme o synthase [Corynebacterium auriscanis]OFT87000.1 protoheme IX farnesyltransferase [Corynebacterium sp. HMSC28B08]
MEAEQPVTTFTDRVKAYIALTKPRVIELLLVATIPAMLQAARGNVDIGLILLTLIGGWMGAASANTFNMVADYDIDQLMRRTRRRPLAKDSVTVNQARVFAWVMMIASVLFLGLLAHSWLAAGFVVLTIWFYIYVYTKWLKRRTWQNVIWGGAAGCMPVIVGWAATTDNHGGAFNAGWGSWIQAIILFMIIFFWTPPHTWALGMRYREDYEAAGVPMMPVVKPPLEVTRQILAYTWATVITSLLLVPAAGWIYAVAALASGAWFIIMAHRLHSGVKNGTPVKPMKLFFLSNNYLSILFVALSVDAVLGWDTVAQLLT